MIKISHVMIAEYTKTDYDYATKIIKNNEQNISIFKN